MMHTFTCRRCQGEWVGEKRRGQTPFYCEPCRPEVNRERGRRYARAARERDPQKVLDRNRAWREANPESFRRSHLKTMYGITPERYEAILSTQGGVCAVCTQPEPGGHGRWHVDHDHGCCPGKRSCGECVRGLLCRVCNSMLIVGYERLPEHLRTWGRMNDYLNGVLDRDPLLAEAS